MNRYRIFMKGNTPYEIGIGNNRFEAINYAVKKGIPKRHMKTICLIKGNGKQREYEVEK